mgnify:FL=1
MLHGLFMQCLPKEKNPAREAILLFPETKDKSIECAYHALVHFEADEDLRYRDFDYREEQDDYLEFIAQTLAEGKSLPRNIIADYEPYYHGVSRRWENGTKGFWKEFLRFINFTTCTDLFLCENKLWTLSVNLTLIIFIIIPMPKEGRKYNSAERIDLRLI